METIMTVLFLIQYFCVTSIAARTTPRPKLEVTTPKVNQQPGANMSRILKQVLKDYDKNIRPFYGAKPIAILVDLLILSFGEIREADMEYSLDLYLAMAWQDPRLALGINRTISLAGDYMAKFWIPDIFFVNSVHAEIHKMLLPNQKVWVNLEGGHIMLSARMKSRASCKMDLRKYPMDEQTCHLALESFSYDKDDLTMKWKMPVGSDVYIYDEEMAQFTIISAKRQEKHKLYHSDGFAGLTVTFKFERRTMYYIFQMYIPCVCIVALSWVSFWIDADAVPARVGLGITTVLTICYMLGHVNFNLPRVSYLKAIDYFLLLSFGCIFLTLVEYVFVLRYARKIKYSGSFVPGTQSHRLLEEEWMDAENPTMEVRITVGGKSYTFSDSVTNLCPSSTSLRNGEVHRDMGAKKPVKVCNHKKPVLRRNRVAKKHSIMNTIKRKFRPGFGGTQIDKYSRFLFPFLYTMFLAIYFVCYLLL